MTSALLSLVLIGGSAEIFAQYEKLPTAGWELRVYELPSQRVLTRRRVYQGEEAPFAISRDGQVAICDYQVVHHWSRGTGWRTVDHFGIMMWDGKWTFGESTAEGSGRFSPDGKHFFFRIYPTQGSSDIGTAGVAVFRTSDLRRWMAADGTASAEWNSNNTIAVMEVYYEEEPSGELAQRTKPRTVRLPRSNRAWLFPPRDKSR